MRIHSVNATAIAFFMPHLLVIVFGVSPCFHVSQHRPGPLPHLPLSLVRLGLFLASLPSAQRRAASVGAGGRLLSPGTIAAHRWPLGWT